METPSSTKRVTRSQTKGGGDGCSRSRSHRADRFALIDITNDSPIAGVTTIAGETKTPASRMKTIPRAGPGDTPCSGETLLRCQVKTLLQRVEEESEFPKLDTHYYLQQQKLCLADKGLISPAGLLAPTPLNTPEIFGISQVVNSVPEAEVDFSLFASVRENDAFHLHEVLDGLNVMEKMKPTESPITRALTFGSPEKSETPASVMTATIITTPSLHLSYQDNCTQEKTADDENSSEWSTRVNVSSPRSTIADEDDGEFAEGEENEEDDAENEEDEFEECNEIDDDVCDELCRELGKICVQVTGEGLPRFTGTHTRFHYNSDDEIEEEEEVVAGASSPNVLQLKGLPTPKGKHMRFPDEEDETP